MNSVLKNKISKELIHHFRICWWLQGILKVEDGDVDG